MKTKCAIYLLLAVMVFSPASCGAPGNANVPTSSGTAEKQPPGGAASNPADSQASGASGTASGAAGSQTSGVSGTASGAAGSQASGTSGTSAAVSTAGTSASSGAVSKAASSGTAGEGGNGKVIPLGRFGQKQFYISTFRAVHFGPEEAKYRKIIAANKEAGINLIENAILSRAEGLLAAKLCEEQGVEFLISNITSDRGYTGMGENCPEVDNDLVAFTVNEMKGYNRLLGYYLWDEVSMQDFARCRNNIELFIRHDPARLAFSILLPSYGAYTWQTPDNIKENSSYYKYVDAYLRQVDPDVLCMDYYALKTASTSLIVNDLWRDMGLFRMKANENGKPFWWYFQACDMADGTVGHMTRAKLAVQMFAGLAYGCKMLSYYQSCGVITDALGNKTSIFEDAKSLNKEVQNVGGLLFNKTSSRIYHTGLTEVNEDHYFLDNMAQSKILSGAPKNTIVSVFKDDTQADYVMVVNKDYSKSVSGSLGLRSSRKVEEYDKVSGRFGKLYDSAASVHMTIGPGDCAVYKLS